jgi:hypothetical protein
MTWIASAVRKHLVDHGGNENDVYI